jgi:hypothetical protein
MAPIAGTSVRRHVQGLQDRRRERRHRPARDCSCAPSRMASSAVQPWLRCERTKASITSPFISMGKYYL